MRNYDGGKGYTSVESDILIIGSGPIGAVYAREINDLDKTLKILMVDMGEKTMKLIGDHKKNDVEVQNSGDMFTQVAFRNYPNRKTLVVLTQRKHRDSDATTFNINKELDISYNNLPGEPVVREVGGMGSYWSCATPEQHPEIERSEIFSDGEWRSLYDRAKTILNTTTRAFDHSIRHQAIKETLMQRHKDRTFVNLPLACQRSATEPNYVRWSCTATILGGLAHPEYDGGNFEILSQHRCNKLLKNFGQRSVEGAELTDLRTGRTVIATAKRYIVCAGAILTPGILFNSNIRPETGYLALGRYLTEQTMAVCQVRMRDTLIRTAWKNSRCEEYSKQFPRDPLRIPPDDPSPQISTPVSARYPWHTQIQQDPYHYNSIPPRDDPRLIIDLRFFGYVQPTYENRVEYSDASDEFGMPRANIHFRLGEEDSQRARLMLKDMVTIASGIGDFVPGGEPRFLPLGAATHVCGTTRAGKFDDGHSVVDKHSKVWRLQNLLVGGCGVIPTQNACNSTLTAACFAIAGARKLVEEVHEATIDGHATEGSEN